MCLTSDCTLLSMFIFSVSVCVLFILIAAFIVIEFFRENKLNKSSLRIIKTAK